MKLTPSVHLNVEQEGDTVKYSKVCSITDELYEVSIPLNKYRSIKSGNLIQNVLPDMSIHQREFIITGITPAEWEDIFNRYGE